MSAVAAPKKKSKVRPTMRTGDVVLAGKYRIPPWVVDLESFRRWARSDQYPESGWFSYLAGELWVDLSMEQAFSHNLVKSCYNFFVGGLVITEGSGYYFSDGMLLSNVEADLSTEPDSMFVSYQTLEKRLARLIKGAVTGFIELEGRPDMTLEIVSDSSVQKDTEILRDLYWRAGIPEYWLVDTRGEKPTFEILRYGVRGYVAVRPQDGWIKSKVFGRSFQLTQQLDRLGHPLCTLAIKP